MPSGEWFDKYLAIRRAAGISEATLQNEYRAHHHFREFLGAGYKSELAVTPQQAQAYARHVNGQSRFTANTKHAMVLGLRPFYSEAVRQEWIIKSPFEDIQLHRRAKVMPKVLTIEQMKRLIQIPPLDTCKGQRDRAIFELMYGSALRRSEVVSLRADAFSEDYRLVRLQGKAGREVMIPCTKQSAHFCSFYARHVRPRLNPHGLDVFFLTMKHGAMKVGSLMRNIEYYLPIDDIKAPLGPHVFRYSIATHLAEEGVDIRLIQSFLRHESVDTTSRYIARSFEHLKEVHHAKHPRA